MIFKVFLKTPQTPRVVEFNLGKLNFYDDLPLGQTPAGAQKKNTQKEKNVFVNANTFS